MTAGEHAAVASGLLADGQRLGLESIADYDRRVALAKAHALVAIALVKTGDQQ